MKTKVDEEHASFYKSWWYDWEDDFSVEKVGGCETM